MSQGRYYLTIVFFILAAWAISNVSLVAAISDVSNGDGGSQNSNEGDVVVILVNGKAYNLPPIAYNEYREMPLTNGPTIFSARMLVAPPGYGCVFISLRPEHLNDEMEQEQEEKKKNKKDQGSSSPFISRPFYSPSSASYRLPEFRKTELDEPFANAESCLCFRLHDPFDVRPSLPPEDRPGSEMALIVLDTERRGSSSGQSRQYYIQFLTLKKVDNEALGFALGLAELEIDVHRAALVYGPRSERIHCIISPSDSFSDGPVFNQREPLLERVDGARRFGCVFYT